MSSADVLSAAHSPLPWLIDPKNDSEVGCPDDQDPSEPWSIAICTRLAPNDPFGKNNAAFIVRACNAHYGLLDAAKGLRQHLALFCGPDDAIAQEVFRIADAAIAAAEAEA